MSVLTWEDLPVEWRGDFCEEVNRRTRKPRAHAAPANFTMDELRELAEWSCCPLCYDPDEPGVLYAVTSQHLYEASEHFDDLTEASTGERPSDPKRHGPYVLRRSQLEDLLQRWPHARQPIKRNARDLRLTIIEDE